MIGNFGGLGGRFCLDSLIFFTNINEKRINEKKYRTIDIIFVVLYFVFLFLVIIKSISNNAKEINILKRLLDHRNTSQCPFIYSYRVVYCYLR